MQRWIVVAVLVSALSACATAEAARKPPITIKVVGFAAIFRNSDHVVRTRSGGVLRRCDDPRSFAVVVDVANVEAGLPYRVIWERNGASFYAGKPGRSGSFDAVPTRVELSFRKAKRLPDGDYVFRFVVDGKVRATGKVKRACAS